MKKFILQPYYYRGIGKNDSGIQKSINVIAGDCETKPFRFIGLKTEDNKVITNLDYKNFFIEVEKLSKFKDTNILSFHNLRFDLQNIMLHFGEYFKNTTEFDLYLDKNFNDISCYILNLYDDLKISHTKKIVKIKDEEKIKELKKEYRKERTLIEKQYWLRIRVCHNKTWFCNLSYGGNKRILIIDTFAFLKNSLKHLSDTLNLDHKKYEFDFTNTELLPYLPLSNSIIFDLKKSLKTYLENDLEVQYDLTKRIIEFHDLYDVRICVSIAQLSARIFKHKFLREGDFIPKIPNHLLKICILSYHGGKNTFLDDKVTKYEDMNLYDIRSLYPWAMSTIPNVLNCEYLVVNEFKKDYEGVYCVTGKLKKSDYAIFYTHDFEKIDKKFNSSDPNVEDNVFYYRIKDLCVTSYELKTALKYKLFELEACYGILIVEKETYNPLKEFVYHFYEKKEKYKNSGNPFYIFYKLILNSLYGKFIQNQSYTRMREYNINNDGSVKLKKSDIVKVESEFQGGTMFNPLIASLITGKGRSLMFEYEVKYNSVHTATDSILTKEKIPTGKNIGDMCYEDSGNVLIFRNKCYVFFGNKIKYALHGFHGKIEDLIKLYIKKGKTYEAERFINIKEGLKCGNKRPCEFQKLPYNFNIKY